MIQSNFFIARRFMRMITAAKQVRTMLVVCCLSIAVATFALALVTAVMQGIEKSTKQKLQGIHPDITIQSRHKKPLAFTNLARTLTKKFPHIISAAPYSHQYAIIQAPATTADTSLHVVRIQGIDPLLDRETRSLKDFILSPAKLATSLGPSQVIISKALGRLLDLELGETLTLLYTTGDNHRSRNIRFEQTELQVSGFFDTGIEEFDVTTIFCSLTTLQEIFPDSGITHVGLKLNPNLGSSDRKAVQEKIKHSCNLMVASWQELYQPLMAALALEKYAMILILTLIALVASMTIISLLLMYSAQKRSSIALLLAMGMPNRSVRSIFIIIGMVIALSSTLVGLGAACGASWLLETHHIITLPDIYYTSHLPAEMTYEILAGVLLLACMASLCATYAATRGITQLSITSILKFDT